MTWRALFFWLYTLVESWLNDMLHYDSNAQSGEASQGLALMVGPGRNRPTSVYRLGEMPIQSCGQSFSARRGKRYTEIGLLLNMSSDTFSNPHVWVPPCNV